MSAKEIAHQGNVRLSLSLFDCRSIIDYGRISLLSPRGTITHGSSSLSLHVSVYSFVGVRLHRDILVISFAIGYTANDAAGMERTALCGMEWFCGESGDAVETAEGLERTSSKDSRSAGQGTSQLSHIHTFLLTFTHSLGWRQW